MSSRSIVTAKSAMRTARSGGPASRPITAARSQTRPLRPDLHEILVDQVVQRGDGPVALGKSAFQGEQSLVKRFGHRSRG